MKPAFFAPLMQLLDPKQYFPKRGSDKQLMKPAFSAPLMQLLDPKQYFPKRGSDKRQMNQSRLSRNV
jgi:hypothetical protein